MKKIMKSGLSHFIVTMFFISGLVGSSLYADDDPICYDPPIEGGFHFFGFSFLPTVTVPIKASEALKNVTIDELHKNIFSFDMFKNNEVIDQDGNYVGNATQSNNGFADLNAFGMDTSLFNTKTIQYQLGDYGPTSDNNYKQLYSNALMGFDFLNWGNSLEYIAHYTDKNDVNQTIILKPCSSSGSNELPHIGYFDAWNWNDAKYGINDRHITTKIVNQDFNLTIASIKDGEVDTQPTEGWNNDIDIKYALVDNDNNENNITDYGTFDASKDAYITPDFNISKAYKDVYVQFKVCSKYDGSDYTLFDYDDCVDHNGNEDECSDVKEKRGFWDDPCIRKFYSTDNFAIRPDHFEINVPNNSIYKADNNMSTISITAVGENGKPVKDYNKSSNVLILYAIDNNSSAYVPEVNHSFSFKDGNATIDYLKYPEVGTIDLNISEINGSEFAQVDEDDTPDDQRLIESNVSNKFRVIPDHFAITNVNVSNFEGGSYTYLSNDLNMSGELNATITAENEANETTINYRAGLYAKDVNISIPFTTSENNVSDKILTQYGENNILIDKNISFTIGEGNFSNGEFNLSLKINFDRKVSKAVNDFNLTLNDLNVTNDDNVTNGNDVSNNLKNQPLTFRYGKAEAEDVSTYGNDVVVPVHYYYYYNNDWVINENHINKTYGDVNDTYPKGTSVTLNENNITKGTQNIDLNLANVTSRPYKETLHLGIDPWLWYSKTGEAYIEPSASNTDCSTHPCSNIIINKLSKDWAGVGVPNAENNVSNNTIKIKRKDINNSNKQIYHKLNW